jgi:hypothetical protein
MFVSCSATLIIYLILIGIVVYCNDLSSSVCWYQSHIMLCSSLLLTVLQHVDVSYVRGLQDVHEFVICFTLFGAKTR